MFKKGEDNHHHQSVDGNFISVLLIFFWSFWINDSNTFTYVLKKPFKNSFSLSRKNKLNKPSLHFSFLSFGFDCTRGVDFYQNFDKGKLFPNAFRISWLHRRSCIEYSDLVPIFVIITIIFKTWYTSIEYLLHNL